MCATPFRFSPEYIFFAGLGGAYSLCLTFDILKKLLLLNDEVFLLGELRLELSHPLLRRFQFLFLNKQALPERHHLLLTGCLQHLGLLCRGVIIMSLSATCISDISKNNKHCSVLMATSCFCAQVDPELLVLPSCTDAIRQGKKKEEEKCAAPTKKPSSDLK